MNKIACAILIIGITFSTPLKAAPKWDKKKAIIGASLALTACACIAGICWLCLHKEEPSSYECGLCKQLTRRSSLCKLHCGHSFCSACMDQIGHTIIAPEYEGRTYCAVCGEPIEASEIYELISEDLQDLITTFYFV